MSERMNPEVKAKWLTALQDRVRFAIAEFVNRLPGQCWADLVIWAMRGRNSKLPWMPSPSCREDMQRTGSCYCGKWRAVSLRDRDGEVWIPEGGGTFTALDGTFSGWRREDIEAQYGPVIEIAEAGA